MENSLKGWCIDGGLVNLEAGYTPIYDMLALDPRLEPLRRDERFKPILEKSRRDLVGWMRVLGEDKSRGELPRYLEAPLANLVEKLNIKLQSQKLEF